MMVKYIFPFVLILLILSLLYANFYFNDKVLAGVDVLGLDVSGMTSDEVSRLVDEKSRGFLDGDIVFRINTQDKGEREVVVGVGALGVTVNSDETVKKVYSYGRSGDFAVDSRSRISSFVRSYDVDPVVSVDFAAFSKKLDEIAAGDIQASQNATIVFDKEPKVVGEKEGRQIDRVKAALDLRNRIRDASTEPIEVSILPELPVVRADKTDKALDRVKRLNNQRIILTFGTNTWRLSGSTLLSVLKFYPSGLASDYASKFQFGDDSLAITGFGDTSDSELAVGVDNDYIKMFTADISKSLNQEKVDATLLFEGGKVKEFVSAQDGQKLDEATTFKLISDAVSADNISAEKDLTINLPVRVVRAKIANDEINSLGIKELIGKGVSYFAGSIANRIYNVSLGASRINGTIVKSGEIFSFNGAVGEVSGATGYKQAYVISSGRTVLDDGGGICQVSTTVFRAALNSGLPIVSRTAHAYRVGYYEQHGFKAGLDATVFAPSVDFAFKNDTDHSILVQTLFDSSSAKLEVDIYGTNDGRRVEISDPVVSDIKPAPVDLFQDDPTLPKGTKKQVDFSAQGATSVFKRKVIKGDKVVIDESFKSVFRPWQAIYLVGTGG